MAGLPIDRGMPKVIDAKVHGIIDYIHAATNFTVGALFWHRNKRASIAAMALGANVLCNALNTDYPLGVFRLYDFKVHGWLDYATAATSAALPAILGFAGEPEAFYFYGQGAGESVIAGISDYDDNSGTQRKNVAEIRRIRMPRSA